MKTILQKSLKLPVILNGLLKQNHQKGLFFLIYHSVAGHLKIELDLPLPVFQRQLELLAQTGRVISYDRAMQLLQSNRPITSESFVLTFDDGYANFYTNVFPLLRQLGLPAILYVTTGFVETGIPYPMMSHRAADVQPVNWDMLAEMVESGLVTIGAHTHTHPNLLQTPEAQLMEELARPVEIFRDRLGITVQHFAYPKALWNEKVKALVADSYTSAVIGGGQKATSDRFDPYLIPRVPVRRSDGWWFFLAKIQGWLAGEEALYEKLRHLRMGLS